MFTSSEALQNTQTAEDVHFLHRSNVSFIGSAAKHTIGRRCAPPAPTNPMFHSSEVPQNIQLAEDVMINSGLRLAT
jgi:hypothetical protein